MEPIKGHESTEDRPNRPFLKAPIPMNLEIDSKSKSKSKKKSSEAVRTQDTKLEKPTLPKVVEEGLLFQREPDEDKLKPTAPVEFQEQPEQQAQQASEPDNEPDKQPEVPAASAESVQPTVQEQASFDAEIEHQKPIVAEVENLAREETPVETDSEVNDDYLTALERPSDLPDQIEADQQLEPENMPPQTPLDAARAAAETAYREHTPDEYTAEQTAAQAAVAGPNLVGAVPLRPAAEQPSQQTVTYQERSPAAKHKSSKPRAAQKKLKQQVTKLKRKLAKKDKPEIVSVPNPVAERATATPVAPRRTGPEVMTMPIPAQTAERPASLAEKPPAGPPPVLEVVTAVPIERQMPTITEQLPPTSSEQMLPAQLVKVAERIYIDGITVKSMFEVGRFDQESLQRIVDTYLKGGNTAKIVYEEVQRHDRERFNRFETLNQVPRAGAAAMYGPITTPASHPQPVQHGSLPRPMVATSDNQMVNPTTQNPKQSPTQQQPQTSTAEKAVLGVSIFFVIIAAVILIGLFTRG